MPLQLDNTGQRGAEMTFSISPFSLRLILISNFFFSKFLDHDRPYIAYTIHLRPGQVNAIVYGFLRSKIGTSGDFYFYFFTKNSFVLGFKSVESRTSGDIFKFFSLGNIHTSGNF